jgi:putative transposase
LKNYAFFEKRGGDVAKTVMLIERPAARSENATHRMANGRPGELVIGLVSDMSEVFGESRKVWRPAREELALEFGLATIFATPDGDLLGLAWRDQLEAHDRRINGLARMLQRQGLKPNHSRRYRARVTAFRGFLKSEIRRVLNRVIMQKRPAHVVLEKLDFRAPGLSRRINRILARSGRVMIRSKMKDFEERYGITFSEVNPAYSSQTCSASAFVAKANRKTQSDFSCRDCGHEIHADVNAARNLESAHSAFDRSARCLTKAQSLEATIRRHIERITNRDRVIPAAVLASPYYRASKAVADPQDLATDVSAG